MEHRVQGGGRGRAVIAVNFILELLPNILVFGEFTSFAWYKLWLPGQAWQLEFSLVDLLVVP